MAEKDDFRIQRARIERVAQELVPGCVVEFDPNQVPTWMKFRITKGSVVLAVSRGDWEVSEIADKSGDWLREFIRKIGGGRI